MAQYGVRLTVSYDGTGFSGFQAQQGQRTVQGEIEAVAAVMAGHPVTVRCAGRTDAGVHALGQIAAFAAARNIDARGWRLGLNRMLPPDVQLQGVEPVAPDYNPRFDALGKHYRYLIHVGLSPNPLLRNHSWYVGAHMRLSLPAMQAAAEQLQGTHDFRAFRASDDQRANTVRTLREVRISPAHAGDPDLWALEVRGNAFMKNMVRILAGTLVDVGRGQLPLERLPELLGPDADRRRAGQTAPPHGLTLMSVVLGRLALEGAKAPKPTVP